MPDHLSRWRDRVAEWVCNWVLRHVATTGYRLRVDLFVRVGMWHVYREVPGVD